VTPLSHLPLPYLPAAESGVPGGGAPLRRRRPGRSLGPAWSLLWPATPASSVGALSTSARPDPPPKVPTWDGAGSSQWLYLPVSSPWLLPTPTIDRAGGALLSGPRRPPVSMRPGSSRCSWLSAEPQEYRDLDHEHVLVLVQFNGRAKTSGLVPAHDRQSQPVRLPPEVGLPEEIAMLGDKE
jgi:hypothetical protein